MRTASLRASWQYILLYILLLLSAITTLPHALASEVTVTLIVEGTDDFGDCAESTKPALYFTGMVGMNYIFNSRDNPLTGVCQGGGGCTYLAGHYYDGGPGKRNFPNERVPLEWGTIPISISQWDRDDYIPFDDDDNCNIGQDQDKALDLILDLANRTVSRDGVVIGRDRETLTARGGQFRFRIEVEDPTSAPDLNVRCIHDPIWPQPGQEVTITAEALNDQLTEKYVGPIEIWVDDRTAPRDDIKESLYTNTYKFTPPDGTNSFNYGCRVIDGDQKVWTGWRRVAVGTGDDPSKSRIRVLETGQRSNNIDIVFYPDRDSYTGWKDPVFLQHVLEGIRKGYLTKKVFLNRQNRINYWIANYRPHADPYLGACTVLDTDRDFPAWVRVVNKVDMKPWEDVGVVLHTDYFRDCAIWGRWITVGPSLVNPNSPDPNTLAHETGHTPFWLIDEYCCNTIYWETDEKPNVYGSLYACEEDAPHVGATASDCRGWTADILPGLIQLNWWTSDPEGNDLMEDSDPPLFSHPLITDEEQRKRFGHKPQPLDERRINWVIDTCPAAAHGGGC